jgi:hypothetical protein
MLVIPRSPGALNGLVEAPGPLRLGVDRLKVLRAVDCGRNMGTTTNRAVADLPGASRGMTSVADAGGQRFETRHGGRTVPP